MKTDQLIARLAVQAEPVPRGAAARALLVAAACGLGAALPLMAIWLGVNPRLAADASQPAFWLKLAFVMAVALGGWHLLRALARPGAHPRRAAWATAAPVLALWALAAGVLALAPIGRRADLVLGSSWFACPLSIAMLALPALVATLIAVRTLAPVRLRAAGAASGLFAGALGALAYVLHCPEFEAPFLAVWYVLGISIPAALGAALGPRVLRW